MTRPDDLGTESPIHDELAIERLREGLARWGEEG